MKGKGGVILVAFGANETGPKGQPRQTIEWAIDRLARSGLQVYSVSPFYHTAPIGQQGQSDYVNAVISAGTCVPPEQLIKRFKNIEQLAGRKTEKLMSEGLWSARALDIDLIDYRRVVVNFKGLVTKNYDLISIDQLPRASLVLPHPRAHERPFVIKPISDILPFWHHPVSHISALSLWRRLQRTNEGRILRRLDGQNG
jgi:2-amino-4-hydroxy-6-hydroxymethyldihydropteridine diphosphokinase